MWVATQDLPRSAVHPFYMRLNQVLDNAGFDGYVESLSQQFYADESVAIADPADLAPMRITTVNSVRTEFIWIRQCALNECCRAPGR